MRHVIESTKKQKYMSNFKCITSESFFFVSFKIRNIEMQMEVEFMKDWLSKND